MVMETEYSEEKVDSEFQEGEPELQQKKGII